MPRRNLRANQEPEPLTIVTPSTLKIPRVRRRPWMSEEDWAKEREERDQRFRKHRAAVEAAARRARVRKAIQDWETCLVPGCEGRAMRVYEHARDVDSALPICDFHAAVIRTQVRSVWETDRFFAVREEVEEHKQEVRVGQERTWEIRENGGQSKGQIYFLRANGLIKVGWSATLTKRLKAYGPDVEILCHYPASRQDETLMHRQLRPYLAKGREWFQDCKLIEDVVAGVIERHGEPTLSATWTQPKEPAIRHHKRAS